MRLKMKHTCNFTKTLLDEILNFFVHGMTSANAEILNGKIERFVSNNYGVKNMDFILYRIAEYFS
jgi:transposase